MSRRNKLTPIKESNLQEKSARRKTKRRLKAIEKPANKKAFGIARANKTKG